MTDPEISGEVEVTDAAFAPAITGSIEFQTTMPYPAPTPVIKLVPAPKVKTYLVNKYGSPAEVDKLVTKLRAELEKWLAPGGAATVSTVADIPTKKIVTGTDYRGILFGPPRLEQVAVVTQFDAKDSFVITGIESLSSLRARGVDFGGPTLPTDTARLA